MNWGMEERGGREEGEGERLSLIALVTMVATQSEQS